MQTLHLFFKLARLPGRIDAKHGPDGQHGQDDADNAKRIGHGVAQPSLGHSRFGRAGGHFAKGLAGGGQGGGIGGRAAVESHSRGQGQAAPEMKRGGNPGPEQDDQGGHGVQAQPPTAQGIDKPRPDLHADGVHKQYQSEFTNEFENVMLQGQAEMAGGQSAEQHAADPEAHAPDAEAAQGQPDSRHKAQHRHGLDRGRIDEKLRKPTHGKPSLRIWRAWHCPNLPFVPWEAASSSAAHGFAAPAKGKALHADVPNRV